MRCCRAASCTKSVASVDPRPTRIPQQVAVALKPVIAKIKFDYFVTALAEPFHEVWHLALARGVHHPAGDHELANGFAIADKHLIRRKDHVLEACNWINSLDLTSALLQSRAEGLPLSLSLYFVYRQLA